MRLVSRAACGRTSVRVRELSREPCARCFHERVASMRSTTIPLPVRALQELGSGVIPVRTDFSRTFDVPEPLDGMLLANALHFVRDKEGVLRRLVNILRPGGRVVIVEYDRRAASRWVPYPINPGAWLKLAQSAGLENPRITARRPSMYAGELYSGVAERPCFPWYPLPDEGPADRG